MRVSLLVVVLSVSPVLASDNGKGGKGDPEGRSAAECIFDLRNGNREAKVAALLRLRELGPKAKEAVPDLVAALSHPDSQIHYLAVEVLGSIGPDAKDAVPTLRLILQKSEDQATYVAAAMFQISKRLDKDIVRAALVGTGKSKKVDPLSGMLRDHMAEALPFIIDMLDDTSKQARLRAIQALHALAQAGKGEQPALEKLGAAAKAIGPALVKRLTDLDHEVALAAAHALVQIDPKLAPKAIPLVIHELKTGRVNEYLALNILKPAALEAIPRLIALLREPNLKGRYQTLWTLTTLDEARGPLEKALEHDNAQIRAGAAEALGHKGSDGAASVPALVAALKDEERAVRLAAASALVSIATPRMAEGVPVLVECLNEGDEATQIVATNVLRHIGPAAKAALGPLRELLKDERQAVRFDVALAVIAIDPAAAKAVVPVLIEGLGTLERNARASAALTLIGPPARDALPKFLALLDDADVHTVLRAAEAVARIDPAQAPRVCRVIGDLLLEKKHQNSMVRSYGIQALARIGADAKSALPALLFILQDDGPFHAEAALAAIGIDPDLAATAVTFIHNCLASDNPNEDSYELLDDLPKLGPKAKMFLPELKVIVQKSRSPSFIVNAVETLGAIGPEAQELVPVLEERLKKENRQSIKRAIEKALKQIKSR